MKLLLIATHTHSYFKGANSQRFCSRRPVLCDFYINIIMLQKVSMEKKSGEKKERKYKKYKKKT